MDATLYWDNKALPTPTLTLPDTFIFNFLVISFIFIENKCFSGVIWKGRKKFAKRLIRTRVDRVKMSRLCHRFYHLRHWSWWWATVFCNVDQSNHTLVGGVSVNSLCHQGRLFALSVNRHSVQKMEGNVH